MATKLAYVLLILAIALVAVSFGVQAQGTGAQVITDPVGDASPAAMDLVRVGAGSEGNILYVWAQVNTPHTQSNPTTAEFGGEVRYLFHLNYDDAWCVQYFGTSRSDGTFYAYDPAGNNRNTEVFTIPCGSAVGYRKPVTVTWACNEVQFAIPFTSLMTNVPGNPQPGPGTTITFQNFPDDGADPATSMQRTSRPGVGWTDGAWGGTTYTLGTDFVKVPNTPTELVATVTGDNHVTLSWNAPAPNNAQPLTFYKVYRSTNGGDYVFVGDTPGTATTFIDSDLPAQNHATPPPTYTYKVSAVNCPQLPPNTRAPAGEPAYTGGESARSSASTEITTVFRPYAPSLGVPNFSGSDVSLSWTRPSDNPLPDNSGIGGYRVYRNTAGAPITPADTLVCTTVGATTTSCTDAGPFVAGTTYHYAVQARDNYEGPDGPNWSPFSNIQQVEIPPDEEPDPDGPSVTLNPATVMGTTRIDLSWTVTLGDAAIQTIQVHRGATPTFTHDPNNPLASLGPGATTYSNTGLTSATQYCYRVIAIDVDGLSGESTTRCATTQSAGGPASVTNLVVAAQGHDSILSTWTLNPGSHVFQTVQVYRGAQGFTYDQSTTPWAILSGTATQYLNTGLTLETEYCYGVRAVTTQGNPFDAYVNETTQLPSGLCATTTGAPPAPPVLSPISDRSITAGNEVLLQIVSTHPDDLPRVLTASNLPAGATFTDHGYGTGRFQWTPTAAQAGVYSGILFKVALVDHPTLSDEKAATITVKGIPSGGGQASNQCSDCGFPEEEDDDGQEQQEGQGGQDNQGGQDGQEGQDCQVSNEDESDEDCETEGSDETGPGPTGTPAGDLDQQGTVTFPADSEAKPAAVEPATRAPFESKQAAAPGAMVAGLALVAVALLAQQRRQGRD